MVGVLGLETTGLLEDGGFLERFEDVGFGFVAFFHLLNGVVFYDEVLFLEFNWVLWL